MKILYLILAHNNPDLLAEQAEVLIRAGDQSSVLIHYDAASSAESYSKLVQAVGDSSRIKLVKERIACRWGSYTLVQAVVNSLEELFLSHAEQDYEYVVLLSGACLPSKPIKQLERFLTENKGKEFIEVAGPEWILDGLREERYRLYFPFAPSPRKSRVQDLCVTLQRALKVRRKVPAGLEVKFGSQWWALSTDTCKKIITYLKMNPSVVSFFKRTFIPDEMVFPTLVGQLVDSDNIANFCLTKFHFSSSGKPVVFYDDHIPYLKQLPGFFFRKVPREASKLRQASYDLAISSDNGRPLEVGSVDTNVVSYILKSQVMFPVPGQMFYYSSIPERQIEALLSFNKPYVVVFGGREKVAKIVSSLNSPIFKTFGNVFHPAMVHFGKSNPSEFCGLKEADYKIRDLNPALYLVRLRSRVDEVPVIFWSPGDNVEICDVLTRDPNALIVLALHNDESVINSLPIPSQNLLRGNQDTISFAQRVFQLVTGVSGRIPRERIIVESLKEEGKRSSGHGDLDRGRDASLYITNSIKEALNLSREGDD
ncbi:MAG TPA: beta-1,6-N-acetylglucosaminyltransferase [Bacillales bacterium]|nr:beta-1,6-N-acetylglucosaminyltransferase [Bacillales bacterium]